MLNKETFDNVMASLGGDADLRAAVIRKLATDFPQDFLAPVKINSEQLGSIIGGDAGHVLISNKEWQE